MDAYLNEAVRYLAAQSWQIATLTVAVTVVTWMLRGRSAHVRYLLWLIVLAKCLVPPLHAVPLRILPPTVPERIPAAWSQPAGTGAFAATPDAVLLDARERQRPKPACSPVVSGSRVPRLSASGWLGVLWLAGAVSWLGMNLLRALRGDRWLRKIRRPLPANAQAEATSLLKGYSVRRLPRIWMAEGVGQPFVWGLLRGSIYVPPGFLTIESPEHRRDILAHELSHVLRLDAGVNTLQVVAQGLFWFHPCVWWTSRRIRREREKCCDETVIARLRTTPRNYGTAILEALTRAREAHGRIPALAVAGPVRNLEERIRTMLQPGKRFYPRPSLTASLFAALVALLTIPTALVLTARAQTELRQAPPPAAPLLCQAAAAGDLEKVKSLIAQGADVNARDFRGTPLHYASERGHTEVVRLLIDRGAHVNVNRWNGVTPLHCAVSNGHRQIAELLLNKGARVDGKSGPWGHTPLSYAVMNFGPGSREMIELLAANGAKIPESHLAVYLGDRERLKKWLQNGKDLNSQESYWGTALHAAARADRKDMAEILLNQGARVDANDIFGTTPLYYAAEGNHEDMMDLLLARGADVNVSHKGSTLLYHAVFDEDTNAARLLISKGAKVNARDEDGGYAPLVHAIWQDRNGSMKGMVELLLEKGADVNIRDNDGHTPLYWAAMKQDSKEIVEVLQAKGATPISTIHMAARAGDLAQVKRFLEEGADVNAKDLRGETPLFAAVLADTPAVAEFLITRGADVNARDKWGATPLNSTRTIWGGPRRISKEMTELLISKGADVNAKDNRGGMARLHWACSGSICNKDVIELLLAHGALVDPKDRNGRTPLFLVCHDDSSNAVEVAELLIAKGARIDAKDNYGSTPLHAACNRGNKHLVELLIAKGADVNARNDRYSVLLIAKTRGWEDIAHLLRRHGAKE